MFARTITPRRTFARDPRFRAADCAAFDARVVARRPLSPPPGRPAERTTSPAALEARRDEKRAAAAGRTGGLMTGRIDGDHHRDDDLSVVAPRAELSASQETA